MIPRIPTPASAFRVFRGFRRAGLTDDEQFLGLLGSDFMPGTPAMLRDLGLAAYLPAVLPQDPELPDLPDEVAIIAYASPERYAAARGDSVVGRMYTHTHRVVFDMDRSRSAPAVAADAADPAATDPLAVYVTGTPCDWQADGPVAFWAGVSTSGPTTDLRRSIVPVLAGLQPSGSSVLETVVQASSGGWAVAWFLLDGPVDDADGAAAAFVASVDAAVPTCRTIVAAVAERRPWIDDPPTGPVQRGRPYSFPFVRDARHFLH